MRNTHIEIAPIAGALGAELGGVDVARDLDDGVIGEIRQALLDYGVIFFRDQHLDIERHKAFTRRFGDIFIHPNYSGVSADPEIVDIRREPGDKKIVGKDWHNGGGATDGGHPLDPTQCSITRSSVTWRTVSGSPPANLLPESMWGVGSHHQG